MGIYFRGNPGTPGGLETLCHTPGSLEPYVTPLAAWKPYVPASCCASKRCSSSNEWSPYAAYALWAFPVRLALTLVHKALRCSSGGLLNMEAQVLIQPKAGDQHARGTLNLPACSYGRFKQSGEQIQVMGL